MQHGAIVRAPPVKAIAGALRGVSHRQDEVGDTRSDFGSEARAVEHAVMADARLQPMRLTVRRYVDAEFMRRLGLADAGNIVVLAFDGEQRDALDRGKIDGPAAMRHLAERQRVAHENGIDRLQIDIRQRDP